MAILRLDLTVDVLPSAITNNRFVDFASTGTGIVDDTPALQAAVDDYSIRPGLIVLADEADDTSPAFASHPQHDLDTTHRLGRASDAASTPALKQSRFLTWCACGHTHDVLQDCAHCFGSGIQKPETD